MTAAFFLLITPKKISNLGEQFTCIEDISDFDAS